MPQHPCLRLFPVPMLQPRCQSWEKLLTELCPFRPALVMEQPRLLMKRLMCPQLEIAAGRWWRAQANFPLPQWEKARDFVAGPTRP